MYEFQGQRKTHPRWAIQTQNKDFDFETKKGGASEVGENEFPEKGIRFYQELMNQKSLDGLPALLVAFKIPLTQFVKERLQPIAWEPSTLSKGKKARKETECKSGCEPTGEGNTAKLTKLYYLKKIEESKFALLAFFGGLVVATYLPPAAKAITPTLVGPNLIETNNMTFHFPSLW